MRGEHRIVDAICLSASYRRQKTIVHVEPIGGQKTGTLTGSQVPPILVRGAKPILQQSAAFGGFSVGFLVECTKFFTVCGWWHTRAKDYDVEMPFGKGEGMVEG